MSREGDIEFAQDLLEKLEDKVGEVMADDLLAIDPVTLCASVEVIAKLALLICSVLGKPVQIDE